MTFIPCTPNFSQSRTDQLGLQQVIAIQATQRPIIQARIIRDSKFQRWRETYQFREVALHEEMLRSFRAVITWRAIGDKIDTFFRRFSPFLGQFQYKFCLKKFKQFLIQLERLQNSFRKISLRKIILKTCYGACVIYPYNFSKISCDFTIYYSFKRDRMSFHTSSLLRFLRQSSYMDTFLNSSCGWGLSFIPVECHPHRMCVVIIKIILPLFPSLTTCYTCI